MQNIEQILSVFTFGDFLIGGLALIAAIVSVLAAVLTARQEFYRRRRLALRTMIAVSKPHTAADEDEREFAREILKYLREDSGVNYDKIDKYFEDFIVDYYFQRNLYLNVRRDVQSGEAGRLKKDAVDRVRTLLVGWADRPVAQKIETELSSASAHEQAKFDRKGVGEFINEKKLRFVDDVVKAVATAIS